MDTFVERVIFFSVICMWCAAWIFISLLSDEVDTKTAIVRSSIIIFAFIPYIFMGVWTFTTTISVIIFFELASVVVVNFVIPTTYHRNGYNRYYHVINDNRVLSLFIQNLNPLRQFFGRLPIWIVPEYYFAIDTDLHSLESASSLWYDIKNVVRHLNLPTQRKETVTQQTYIICLNITRALWKLAALDETKHTIIERFDKDGKNRQEIDMLSEKVRSEIQHALEILTPFSVYLAKLRVSGISVSSEFNDLVNQIEVSSKELAEATKTNRQNFIKESSDYSLWSYTMVFVIVVATFTLSSMYAPNYAFAVTVSGSLLGLLVIGILNLRDSEKISENSFTQIIIEFLKSIRLLK